jgi:hypothetical protein
VVGKRENHIVPKVIVARNVEAEDNKLYCGVVVTEASKELRPYWIEYAARGMAQRERNETAGDGGTFV